MVNNTLVSPNVPPLLVLLFGLQILTRAKRTSLSRIVSIAQSVDGKDKVFKLIQYLLKLYSMTSSTKNPQLSRFVSLLSLSRKIMRFGHWIDTYGAMERGNLGYSSMTPSFGIFINPGSMTSNYETFQQYVDLANDICDDLSALSRFGLTPPNSRIDNLANHLWMISILLDVRKQCLKARNIKGTLIDRQEYALQSLKLLCDFVFCAIDLLHLNTMPKTQALCAAISAFLGVRKCYLRNIV